MKNFSTICYNLQPLQTVIVEYVHFVSREKMRVTNGNGYETGLDPNEVNVKTEENII